jgi:hypothetical protein
VSPDVLSAYGTATAAAIALLALIVSIYAAVVARRAAKATESQTAIAAKAYRLSATPKISLDLRFDLKGGLWHSPCCTTIVRRAGGPPEVWWRVRSKVEWMTTPYTGKLADSEKMHSDVLSMDGWFKELHEGKMSMVFHQVQAKADALTYVSFEATIEMIEAPADGIVPDNVQKWIATDWIRWRPDRQDTSA